MKTKLLKRTLLLLAMLLACAVQSRATDFTYNGLTYTILTDNTCQTKAGEIADDYESVSPGNSVSGNLVIPEVAYYNNKAYTVTEIGDLAFYECTGLTDVSIPNSVTSISFGAFAGCTGLTEVTIPNSVTTIDYSAFSYCTGLTKVTIPNSVTTIDYATFYYCTGLTEVTIPSSVMEIDEDAFYGCSGITELNFADTSDELILGAAFEDVNPTKVYYGRKLSWALFEGKTTLKSLTIGHFVKEIGSEFNGCSGITELNFADTSDELTILGTAFKGVNPTKVYYGRKLSTPLFQNSKKMKSLTIGFFINEIGREFNGCSGITELNFVDKKNKLYFDAYAFEDVNPTTVYLGRNLGANIFEGNTRLEGLTIGKYVTSMTDVNFKNCTGLKWIESQAVTPPTIYSTTFSDYSVPLLVASEDYKTTNYWENFTNIVVPYTPTSTTFEVDGLKYEVISVNDLTCRLYAIDGTVTGENVVIPEIVVYKNCTFTPVEIKGILRKGITSVKSVSIPSCTTTISNGTMWNTKLSTLTVSAPVTTNFAYASSIDELVVTPSVPQISNDLRTNTIGKITIEDSETALNTTQLKCSGTKEVYLGRNVSASTFEDMTALEKVTISDKVTAIRESAFSGCTAIRTVVSRNTTPPTTDDPFSNETYLEGLLYVPDASIEAYQAAAGWKNFWEVKPLSEYNGVKEIVIDNREDVISVDNGAISVNSDSQVRIVALNGTTVYSGRGEARVNVTPGIYVVIVGNKAHKVAVR
jgi:hypothetical protein